MAAREDAPRRVRVTLNGVPVVVSEEQALRCRYRRADQVAQKEDKSERPSPADVRAWAREAGVDCPKKGRIPKDVFAAYEAAHD